MPTQHSDADALLHTAFMLSIVAWYSLLLICAQSFLDAACFRSVLEHGFIQPAFDLCMFGWLTAHRTAHNLLLVCACLHAG